MSNKVGQKAAVYNTITGFFADNGIDFSDNEVVARDVLTKEGRATVIGMLIEATRNGEVDVGGKTKTYDYNDTAQMKEYWSGTVTNWLTRDPRFNLGNKHKSDPSKSKSRDSKLKALTNLLSQSAELGASEEDIMSIKTAIEARRSEIAAEKSPTVKIEASDLPEELRHLVG